MHNGGRALLAVLILFVRIEIRVATFGTNHSVADSTQSIHRCFNHFTIQSRSFLTAVKSASQSASQPVS